MINHCLRYEVLSTLSWALLSTKDTKNELTTKRAIAVIDFQEHLDFHWAKSRINYKSPGVKSSCIGMREDLNCLCIKSEKELGPQKYNLRGVLWCFRTFLQQS